MDGADADTRTHGRRRAVIKDAARYKTVMCQNWLTQGSCPYKSKCQFAHGDAELRKRIIPYTPPPPRPTAPANLDWRSHSTVCIPIFVPVVAPAHAPQANAAQTAPQPQQPPLPPTPRPPPPRMAPPLPPPRPTAPVSLWGDGATWQSDALATDWRPAARATAGVPSRVEPPWIGARNSSSEVSFSDVRRQISLFLRDTDDSQETAAEDTTGDTTDIPIDATPPTPTRRASGSFTPMSCRTPIRKPRTPSRSGPPPVRRHQCRPTATRVGLDLVSGSPTVAGHVAPLG